MTAIRAGICLLLAFEVLALGGVGPAGRGILEIGAAGLFLVWGVVACRRRCAEIFGNWLYLPLLGLGAFAAVQYLAGISAYPYATKLELLEWGAHVLLFFLAVEAFRASRQRAVFAWFLLTLGFLVSLFAIVQHFTFNGSLYGVIPLPSGSRPFGPYLSRDLFAGFIDLIAPLGLALLLFRACRRERIAFLFLFTSVCTGAAILSASRGGILALAFECVLLLFLSRVQSIGKRQALIATALVLAAGIFVVGPGANETIRRFQRLVPGELSWDLRVSMDRDTWRIFSAHPWFGTGLGTLRTVYPRYASFYLPDTIVNHAHNDYLELLADTGLVGGFCGLAFIGLLAWHGLKNLQASESRLSRAVVAGSLAACAGMLLHSLVDFNLHIPANSLIFLFLAALATSKAQDPRPRPPRGERLDAFPDRAPAEMPRALAVFPR